MITIKNIPYKKLIETFGDPETDKVVEDFTTGVFPFPMVYGNRELATFTGHKYIVPAVIDALKEILDIYGPAEIERLELNKWSGCYNKRKTKSGDWWSVHSWGLAIDYLANYGPFKRSAMTPYLVVQAFKKRGFAWGGDWNNLRDGMHFSASEG